MDEVHFPHTIVFVVPNLGLPWLRNNSFFGLPWHAQFRLSVNPTTALVDPAISIYAKIVEKPPETQVGMLLYDLVQGVNQSGIPFNLT